MTGFASVLFKLLFASLLALGKEVRPDYDLALPYLDSQTDLKVWFGEPNQLTPSITFSNLSDFFMFENSNTTSLGTTDAKKK